MSLRDKWDIMDLVLEFIVVRPLGDMVFIDMKGWRHTMVRMLMVPKGVE
jgi:hypothetical protein